MREPGERPSAAACVEQGGRRARRAARSSSGVPRRGRAVRRRARRCRRFERASSRGGELGRVGIRGVGDEGHGFAREGLAEGREQVGACRSAPRRKRGHGDRAVQGSQAELEHPRRGSSGGGARLGAGRALDERLELLVEREPVGRHAREERADGLEREARGGRRARAAAAPR